MLAADSHEADAATSRAPASVHLELALPQQRRGVEWRALDAASLPQLSALIARIEAQDNPPYRTSSAEVAEMLQEDRPWLGLAAYATRGLAAGRMIAWAQVVLRRSGDIECMCQGGVDPSFRRIGLGGAIVEWQEETARAMIAEVVDGAEGAALHAGSDGVRAHIAMHVEPGQSDFEEHLRARGFHWARTYYELRAELSRIPDAPELGRYVSVEPWGPQWEEPARNAANVLSEIEWGRPPVSKEQWLMGRSAFEPQWSFVLVDQRGDRPRVLGFLMASKYVQDWAALGWREGYIDQMGVLESARSTSGVDALIIASMRAMAASGMDRVATGLGSANHTGALAVYDRLGFATVGQTRLYALEV